MYEEHPRQVRTGGDPRSLSEFMALRDEMSKLTHPARPDVDWKRAEALSLSLFEINGVELQTSAWYTLARSHLARVSGLNEGLAILTALLSHQWAQLWPQPAHARAEIINGLLQRIQKLFRTFSLGPADEPDLVLAEKRLLEIKEILKRQELEHACQMNPLMQLIRSALSRLEKGALPKEAPTQTVAPEQGVVVTQDAPASRLVYVIQKEPEVEIVVTEEQSAPPKRWPVFVAGMVTAVVFSALTVFAWQAFHRPDETTPAMAASVDRMPEAMTQAQIETFRQAENGKSESGMWLTRISNQLNWITTQTPGWRLRYGQGLVSQARELWPDDPATRALAQRWDLYLAGRMLTESQLNGWHDGMTQLRALSAQLDALDRQKGKYMTASELKTLVWRITSAFASAVPMEEQLRQLALAAGEANAPQVSLEQAARHLDSLILVLEQVSPQKDNVTAVKSTPPAE